MAASADHLIIPNVTGKTRSPSAGMHSAARFCYNAFQCRPQEGRSRNDAPTARSRLASAAWSIVCAVLALACAVTPTPPPTPHAQHPPSPVILPRRLLPPPYPPRPPRRSYPRPHRCPPPHSGRLRRTSSAFTCCWMMAATRGRSSYGCRICRLPARPWANGATSPSWCAWMIWTRPAGNSFLTCAQNCT